MKAIVYRTYGKPDVLQLEEVEMPVPKDNEVLIKLCATSVSAVDSTFRKGDDWSARMFTGLMRPKRPILGSDFAGIVAATGNEVTRFNVGDQLFGATAEFGAYAEYICLPADGVIASKPASLSFEEAAAIPGGALTALAFLRDTGAIQPGHQVLINGGSGAVGTYAVQLAKYFGAEVTAVCSSANVELVKSLGADKVIDYTKEDFTKNGERYDIIFDTVAKSSFAKCKDSLKPGGSFLAVALSLPLLFQIAWTSRFGSKRAKLALTGLRPAHEQQQDLLFLKELIEAGTLKPIIDKSYRLEDIAEAHAYVDTGRKRGNVVIIVEHSDKQWASQK